MTEIILPRDANQMRSRTFTANFMLSLELQSYCIIKMLKKSVLTFSLLSAQVAAMSSPLSRNASVKRRYVGVLWQEPSHSDVWF